MELKTENEHLENDLKATKYDISSLTEQTDVAFEDQEINIEYYTKNINQNYRKHDSIRVSL